MEYTDILLTVSRGAMLLCSLCVLVRCLRYFILITILFTVYPIAFRYTAKIGRKKDSAPEKG